MFCCTLLYVHFSIAIILMGKRELIALLNLSSWCLVMVERLFLTVPRGCLQFVIVVFPDHTHLLIWVRSDAGRYVLIRFVALGCDMITIGQLLVIRSAKIWSLVQIRSQTFEQERSDRVHDGLPI